MRLVNGVAVPYSGAGTGCGEQPPNAPRSSARSIASGEVPTIGHARVRAAGQVERRLPAELDDHAGDRSRCLLGMHDLEHVSKVSGSK